MFVAVLLMKWFGYRLRLFPDSSGRGSRFTTQISKPASFGINSCNFWSLYIVYMYFNDAAQLVCYASNFNFTSMIYLALSIIIKFIHISAHLE